MRWLCIFVCAFIGFLLLLAQPLFHFDTTTALCNGICLAGRRGKASRGKQIPKQEA